MFVKWLERGFQVRILLKLGWLSDLHSLALLHCQWQSWFKSSFLIYVLMSFLFQHGQYVELYSHEEIIGLPDVENMETNYSVGN